MDIYVMDYKLQLLKPLNKRELFTTYKEPQNLAENHSGFTVQSRFTELDAVEKASEENTVQYLCI
jgi:hypothetical protein